MRKKILIFILAIMGMFTLINAATVELAVTNGTFNNYFTVGISPSFRLFNNFYLEGEFFYFPRTKAIRTSHTEYINGEGIHVSDTRTIKTSATYLNVSALYQLKFKSTQKLVPFLTAGGGRLSELEKGNVYGRVGDNVYSRSGSSTDDIWSFSFGCGIKYGFNDKVGVRFDGRFLFTVKSNGDGGNEVAFFGSRFTGGFYIKL